jgi:peptidoglycan/xylan/chitin deacetylase (PgdA/CDA1 family)
LAALVGLCWTVAACGAGTSVAGVPVPSTPGPQAAPSSSPSPSPSLLPTSGRAASTLPRPLAAASSTGAPACSIPPGLAGSDISRLPVTDKVIALTFDGGANADGVPSIRATLGTMKVKATFFLTGSFVKTYPVKSARLAARDVVGNHTMTHPDLTTLTDAQVTSQVRGAENLVRSTTGQDPRRFFRFPYGARNAHAIALLNSLCYVPFRWTVDSLGWEGTSGGQTRAKVVARVVAAAQPGAIVLMHLGSNPDDGTTLDAAALPTIITRLRALGYHFVWLARVMSAAP